MPSSEELQQAFAMTKEALDIPDEADADLFSMLEGLAVTYQEQADLYFDTLGSEIHETNVEKGFWGDPEIMDKYVAKLGLIHSEVTEVLEALRKGQGADKVTEEFADVLIRTFDLYATLVEAGEADPKLWKVMRQKMEDNKARPVKHGNRWG